MRGHKEKVQNELTGDRRFEDEGAALADKGLDYTVEVYMSEKSKERVTVLQVGTQLQE